MNFRKRSAILEQGSGVESGHFAVEKEGEYMQFGYRFYFGIFLVILVSIGVLPFFNHPTYMDYILLITAILFGVLGWIRKFKVKDN